MFFIYFFGILIFLNNIFASPLMFRTAMLAGPQHVHQAQTSQPLIPVQNNQTNDVFIPVKNSMIGRKNMTNIPTSEKYPNFPRI